MCVARLYHSFSFLSTDHADCGRIAADENRDPDSSGGVDCRGDLFCDDWAGAVLWFARFFLRDNQRDRCWLPEEMRQDLQDSP